MYMFTRLWYANMHCIHLTNLVTKPDSLSKNEAQIKIILLFRTKRPNLRRQTNINHPNKHQR